MLSDVNNNSEIEKEVISDHNHVLNGSISYLLESYRDERMEMKIETHAVYPKIYEIKTASNNDCLIVLKKSNSVEKFNGEISSFFFLHQFTNDGLRVYTYNNINQHITVFNPHVLESYRINMGLDIVEPLDIAKDFFLNNHHFAHMHLKKVPGFVATICKNGILLGDTVFHDGWIVHQIFISNQELSDEQKQFKTIVKDFHQQELNNLLSQPNEDFDKAIELKNFMDGIGIRLEIPKS